MKKVLSLIAVAGLIAASSSAFGASIVNTKHNLAPQGKGSKLVTGAAGTSTQVCIYCHAPHNAKESLPLWNRNNAVAAGAFTLYSGLGMSNVSFKTGFTSDSTSLFCMSCHDGTTSMSNVHNVGNIINASGETLTSGQVTGNAALGSGNLSKTHPINFPVTLNTTNDLNLGSGSVMGPIQPALVGTMGYTAGPTFPLFKTTDANAARSTTNRSLECASCHAVHDATFSPFLRDTMNGSQLCLGCHNK